MLKWQLLEQILLISSINGSICVSFIQKIKKYFRCSDCIPIYSLIINMIFAILFSLNFTTFNFINSLWIGLFSYIGSDTLYKSLEGKLQSYNVLRKSTNRENNK